MMNSSEINYTWSKKKRIDLFKLTVAILSLITSVIILSGIVADTKFSREILIICFSGVFLLTVLIVMNRDMAFYELRFDGVHLKYTIKGIKDEHIAPTPLEQLKYEPIIQSMNIQCLIPFRTIEAIEWNKSHRLIVVKAAHSRYMEIEVDSLTESEKNDIYLNLKNLMS